jgi:cell division protein FtsB
VTAPSPPRRSNTSSTSKAQPTRRGAAPAAVPTRGRPRPTSAARSIAARTRGEARPAAPAARSVRSYAKAHAGGLTLTTRAALLGLALCAVVLTLAYPLREYLSEHRQINQLAAQVNKDRATVEQMRVSGRQDVDPQYIEQQARIRLHMQRQGDLVFQLPPPLPAKITKQQAGAVRTPVLPGHATEPWYTQLYRSTVESAK